MPSGKQIQFFLEKYLMKSIVTSLVIAYFVTLPGIGNPENAANDRRIRWEELGVISLVLLYNSNFVQRLREMSFGKDGVGLKLDKIQKNVTANRDASQAESKAIAFLGMFIQNDEHRKKFYEQLLGDGELELLRSLFDSELHGKRVQKIKTEVEQHLRHLRSLNFIKSKTPYEISELPDFIADLKEYFQLTSAGKLCLALGPIKEFKPEHLEPEFRELYNSIREEKERCLEMEKRYLEVTKELDRECVLREINFCSETINCVRNRGSRCN
jgi:hypothetical protein